MKRIVLVTALFTSAACIAQPTLTLSNFGFAPGKTYYEHHCSGAGITPGPAGASVSWNFASLVTMSQDTLLYKTCTSTPNCDSFPGTTMAMEYLGYGFTGYIKANATNVSVLGYYVSGMGAAYYSKQRIVMHFPTTYNTFHADSFAYGFAASPGSYSGLDTNIADAYGTLVLPSGTHTNVLRVQRKSHEKDSASGTAFYSYNETYTWYKAGFSSPLLILNYYDTTGLGTMALTDIIYYTGGNTTSVNENTPASVKFEAYPTPATDILHIKLEGKWDENVEIILTNAMGRVVMQQEVNGKNEVALNVADLPAGIYITQVKCQSASATQKVIIAR